MSFSSHLLRQCVVSRWRFVGPRRLFSANASPPPPPPPPQSGGSSSSSSAASSSSSATPPPPSSSGSTSQEGKNGPEGELNDMGYFNSRSRLTHAWSTTSGGLNRGQALYQPFVMRHRFHQFLLQRSFNVKWFRRLTYLFFVSMCVGGLVSVWFMEGDDATFEFGGDARTNVRIAAHCIKNNPAAAAALGPFLIDFPGSLFVRKFTNNRAGLTFAVIGARSRGVVSIEVSRAYKGGKAWTVTDFSLDLLDGTSIEILPTGTIFTTKKHKADIKTAVGASKWTRAVNDTKTAKHKAKHQLHDTDIEVAVARNQREALVLEKVRKDALENGRRLDVVARAAFGLAPSNDETKKSK